MCLNESQETIDSLFDSGFNIQRANDTLVEAQLLFSAQLRGYSFQDKDFSKVIRYCSEIKEMKVRAFIARDEFNALFRFYNATITSSMNSSTIDVLIARIENEIASERYENVKSLIDSTYDEISSVQAEYSALNVFYMNTTRSLKIFFQKNWLSFSVVVIILIILYISYRLRVRRWIIERKIKSLESRKATIKSLIMDLQRGYFHSGDVSQAEYTIKTKKFGELIRDIDRQIPLLLEQLAKVKSKFIKTKRRK